MIKAAHATPNTYLIEERLKRNLLQKEVANHIGPTSINIRRWEGGITAPNVHFRRQLCLFYNKSEQELGFMPAFASRQSHLQNKANTIPYDIPAILGQSKLFLPAWNICYKRNPLFTGRERVIERLHQAFNAHNMEAPIQALCGLGGIGKTQVALEYSYRYCHEYQTIIGVRATSREMLIADFTAIVGRFYLPEQEKKTPQEVLEFIKNWLYENSQWLLVIDDIEDFNLLNEFLPSVIKGHVLLTTARNITKIVARPIFVEPMDLDEGIYFLLRRANLIEAHVSFEKIAGNKYACAEKIVQLFDGHPLALDQAGAYIEETACTLEDYLHTYQQHSLALLSLRGNAPIYHPNSVTDTILSTIGRAGKICPFSVRVLWMCAQHSQQSLSEELITQKIVALPSDGSGRSFDTYALNAIIKNLRLYHLVKRNSSTKTVYIPSLVKSVLMNVAPGEVLFEDGFPQFDDEQKEKEGK